MECLPIEASSPLAVLVLLLLLLPAACGQSGLPWSRAEVQETAPETVAS
eukprot:COSAG02_NODE_5388_length_4373_cov_9.024801_3_plen_49_part_00